MLLAAGDIGDCGSPGAVETGRMLDRLSGTVLALGDLAYPSGREADFRECYDPVWGRHKSRTRPVPGNHEYETAGATPYYDYFGPPAGQRGEGFYAFQAGGWMVVAINSNIGVDFNSGQVGWLRSQLRIHTLRCALVYFHHPLVSSGPNGGVPRMASLWQVLYEHGVDVVLNADEHMYERLAPMTPNQQPDEARGIRQFIAGTGGARLYRTERVHPLSEVRISAHGLLRLSLRPDGYEWEFLDIDGGRPDSGAGTCH